MKNQPVSHKITRSELYDLIWKTPMQKLAPTFGLSGVGLAKLCRRSGIPLPPREYWAKLQFGKRVRRPALPSPPQGVADELIISASEPRDLDLPPEIAEAINAQRSAGGEIAVPHSPKPHPIVQAWGAARQPSYGPPIFTPAAEARRRRIASVLFREIEKRGGKITANGEHKFDVAIFGQSIQLALAERLTQVQVTLSERERKLSWIGTQEYRELRPTGLLRLRFENYFDSPIRREWNETLEKPLENRLREIIIGLFIAAAAEKRSVDARAAWERQRLVEEQRRYDEEERRRKERARVKALLEESDAWVQAARIREYIAAAQIDRGGEWAKWAQGIADSLDPCVKK